MIRDHLRIDPGGLLALTQLRDDLRKMKAHGLVEREAHRDGYQLTDKSIQRLVDLLAA